MAQMEDKFSHLEKQLYKTSQEKIEQQHEADSKYNSLLRTIKHKDEKIIRLELKLSEIDMDEIKYLRNFKSIADQKEKELQWRLSFLETTMSKRQTEMDFKV